MLSFHHVIGFWRKPSFPLFGRSPDKSARRAKDESCQAPDHVGFARATVTNASSPWPASRMERREPTGLALRPSELTRRQHRVPRPVRRTRALLQPAHARLPNLWDSPCWTVSCRREASQRDRSWPARLDMSGPPVERQQSGPPLRRAGQLPLSDNGDVLWSVAEGRRGLRWRAVRRDRSGAIVSDLFLELDPAGHWSRLELATSDGILTLHPEPDGSAVHGNVVTPNGVRPLALAWSATHRLLLPGDPVAAVALGAEWEDAVSGPGIVVGADLSVTATDAISRPTERPGSLPGPSWPLEAG